jgi:hypothetical protein
MPMGQSKSEDAHVKTEKRMKAVTLWGSRGFTETVLDVRLQADSRTHEVSASRQSACGGGRLPNCITLELLPFRRVK